MLEHLYAHEVYPALRQFIRVLKPDGFALIMSPDLEAVAHHIIEHGVAAVAYESPAGPIRPLDMLYGHTRAIERGHYHMAHRTGFTAERLGNLLLSAGFSTVSTRTENFEVCALALMPKADGRRNPAGSRCLRLRFPGTIRLRPWPVASACCINATPVSLLAGISVSAWPRGQICYMYFIALNLRIVKADC